MSDSSIQQKLPRPVAEFTEEQLKNLRLAAGGRWKLSNPTILIIEDQPFSRCMLDGMICRKGYPCNTAINGEHAIKLYAEIAPCITFLDIELPDIDGHTLAALFKKHDPDSYIVMVTANNYFKDVEAAKANKVQGFIIKPYNQQKIMETINTFVRQKQKG